MIREDRELLAELARLNTDMAALAMRIMDDSASSAEQQNYGLLAVSSGFGDQVGVGPAWWVAVGVVVSLGA